MPEEPFQQPTGMQTTKPKIWSVLQDDQQIALTATLQRKVGGWSVQIKGIKRPV